MKTKEEYEKFVKELKELCDKHNIYLLGTCSSEGILGEITLIDGDNPELCGWDDAMEDVNFKLFPLYGGEGYYI